MKRGRWIAVLATVLALLAVSLSTVSADAPGPACDQSNPNSVCKGNITVFVFVDRVERGGLNVVFNNGADSPLAGARVTLVMPDGTRLQRITGHTGLLNFPGVDLLPEDVVLFEVEFPARYRDTGLVPCPSSPTRKEITPASFGSLRSTRVVFCAWQHLPAATPSGPH